ncbi:unnamed protein product [Auanema sp. JU1783]|nr:unnamed protein product [Auanema sp. JU1783]
MSLTNESYVIAQRLLEESNYVVEAALDSYFNSDPLETVVPTTVSPAESSEGPVDLDGLEITVMSWNIDGLDARSIRTRMMAVYKIVKMHNPDFLFLQEVVEREIEHIQKLEKFYKIYYANRGALYFTAILVSRAFEVENHEVIHYRNSGMMRTLQIVKGFIGEQVVFLLNTHLESMAEHSDKRKEQFAQCMEKVKDIIKANPNSLLFFGGDLNIRDHEISNVPRGLADAWVAAGADRKTEFTWDTRLNDNKSAHGARKRFDRIFWYGPLKKVQFSLQGQSRIRSCLCFPSDHWAVLCNFS